MKRGLSKSKIVSGLQCPKRLYLSVHQPELADDTSGNVGFTVGNQFGEFARSLFPGGVLVEQGDDLAGALDTTRRLLADDAVRVIYEATVSYQGTLVRVDVLEKTKRGVVLTEIKSSTGVKDYHRVDAAIQKWVLQRSGISVVRTQLGHVNSDFIYQGDGDYAGILEVVDISEQIAPIVAQVDGWVAQFQEVLAGKVPDIEIGEQCSSPFDCPFRAHCWPQPAEYPVSCLPGKGKIVRDLLAEGIEDIRDIPPGRLKNEEQEWVRRVTVAGKEELRQKAAELINKLPYPRYHLDFETAGLVIPRWAGTRPYESLPFQWSCHIERGPDELDHAEFLDTSGAAPMRPLAEAMIDALGESGPVFTYTTFENGVIRGLKKRFPDLKEPLNKILDRLVDLHPIVKDHYYHPQMRGSWSIKKVLPAMAPDLHYDQLEGIKGGMAASNAYGNIVDPRTPQQERERLAQELRDYCKLDTLAMVRVARRLANAGR
jgi:hypothetical protein